MTFPSFRPCAVVYHERFVIPVLDFDSVMYFTNSQAVLHVVDKHCLSA